MSDAAAEQSRYEDLMRLALGEAVAAMVDGDVPVGCVIVRDDTGEILATGRNRREVDEDPTAHAEIVAMRAAARKLGHWRLVGCTLVVTLEPCCMCAGAIVNARVPTVVWGAPDPKAGAGGGVVNLLDHPKLNHRPKLIPGVLGDECGELLREFFRKQRALGKK